MENLKVIWNELVLNYTDDVRLVTMLWKEIEKAYSGKNRHYHNLAHLKYMIDKAFEYKDSLNDPDTVMFSIFYHDIVYNSTSQDNEQKSANIAKERLTLLGVPSEKVSWCQNQIIATKNHQESVDNDTNYLLDFDLAVLGDTPESYNNYTKKIRREYSIFPDFLYNKGRKKVLRHFLNMDKIFKTNDFYKKYEKQAKENINTELQGL